jgi:hypothetical protein
VKLGLAGLAVAGLVVLTARMSRVVGGRRR